MVKKACRIFVTSVQTHACIDFAAEKTETLYAMTKWVQYFSVNTNLHSNIYIYPQKRVCQKIKTRRQRMVMSHSYNMAMRSITQQKVTSLSTSRRSHSRRRGYKQFPDSASRQSAGQTLQQLWSNLSSYIGQVRKHFSCHSGIWTAPNQASCIPTSQEVP